MSIQTKGFIRFFICTPAPHLKSVLSRLANKVHPF